LKYTVALAVNEKHYVGLG